MLKEGDILSLEDGRELPIQSIKEITYSHYINVYNFEVEDYRTYYVSDESVLVHNMCARNFHKKNKNTTHTRQTPDQAALVELGREAIRRKNAGKPISYEEAKILDEWAKEYNVYQHHGADYSAEHFSKKGIHTHIYSAHIPYEKK